jgi:hypothetical protein
MAGGQSRTKSSSSALPRALRAWPAHYGPEFPPGAQGGSVNPCPERLAITSLRRPVWACRSAGRRLLHRQRPELRDGSRVRSPHQQRRELWGEPTDELSLGPMVGRGVPAEPAADSRLQPPAWLASTPHRQRRELRGGSSRTIRPACPSTAAGPMVGRGVPAEPALLTIPPRSESGERNPVAEIGIAGSFF